MSREIFGNIINYVLDYQKEQSQMKVLPVRIENLNCDAEATQSVISHPLDSDEFVMWFEQNYEWIKGSPYQYGGDSLRHGVDCSHFVAFVLSEVHGSDVPYVPSSDIPKSDYYQQVETPQAGDVIRWPGHVGLVVDPKEQIFMGAQVSTGVSCASYDPVVSSYWGMERGRISFFRYQPQ